MFKKKLLDIFAPSGPYPQKLRDQIKTFDRLKIKEKILSKKVEEIKEKRILAEKMLYDIFKDAGLEAVKTETGTFSMRDDWYASFAEGKKEEGFDWLRELGYEDMIHETINANTFAAFIKELKFGEKIEIPDFVNIHIINKIGISRRK